MHQDKNIGSVLAIRHFNRFFTQEFGFLDKRILGSAYSLVEARVLYELANGHALKAADIAATLKLDAGYLSRILKRFDEKGLLLRTKSREDGRCMGLSLTESGLMATAELADIANVDIARRVDKLNDQKLHDMVNAMKKIETILDETMQNNDPVILRRHGPGDIGWIASSQSKFYADVYGFDENFEALVMRICAQFISNYEPDHERCWIAERAGKNIGSIMLVREDERSAKLRLFFVDPDARGLGLGTRLVDECLSFAKRTGYERVVLYTNACLDGARRIYERAGFHLIAEAEHTKFGAPQVEQDWVLEF